MRAVICCTTHLPVLCSVSAYPYTLYQNRCVEGRNLSLNFCALSTAKGMILIMDDNKTKVIFNVLCTNDEQVEFLEKSDINNKNVLNLTSNYEDYMNFYCEDNYSCNIQIISECSNNTIYDETNLIIYIAAQTTTPNYPCLIVNNISDVINILKVYDSVHNYEEALIELDFIHNYLFYEHEYPRKLVKYFEFDNIEETVNTLSNLDNKKYFAVIDYNISDKEKFKFTEINWIEEINDNITLCLSCTLHKKNTSHFGLVFK